MRVCKVEDRKGMPSEPPRRWNYDRQEGWTRKRGEREWQGLIGWTYGLDSSGSLGMAEKGAECPMRESGRGWVNGCIMTLAEETDPEREMQSWRYFLPPPGDSVPELCAP